VRAAKAAEDAATAAGDEAEAVGSHSGLESTDSVAPVPISELTPTEDGGRPVEGASVPFFRAQVVSMKPTRVRAGSKMLEMRLEDESAVPLRAIAFAQQAEAFEETFHVGDSVVVKGGVVKALEQRFRKGDWRDTKMELIFRWWTMVESSPEPVAPGYPADNEPSEAPTTASKRLNCYDRLMELRTRWAAANDGAELPIINVENEFGKEPTTFFFVDGVWQRGKTAFCALLSKVDMPDADTSVHEDLLKHLSTYGAGHEKSMVRFMTTMEWCDVNNRLKPGEYPFADGILNLLSGERRPISPEDYLTKKSSRKMPDRETWDGVVDTYEFKNVSEQFQKILPCKGLQEEVMWRLAVYLMDPDKSLHKQHLNI